LFPKFAEFVASERITAAAVLGALVASGLAVAQWPRRRAAVA
jgi:hypothetical protein